MSKNRLRDLRKEKRLTIAQAANIFHLQPTQYRRYEMNESDLPIGIAITMAKYFDVTLDYLVYLSEDRNPINTQNNHSKIIEEFKRIYIKYLT